MEASGELHPKRSDGVAVFLFGTGTAFGAGNIGPVVPEIANDFGLTLGGVGLLSGTVFFAAVVVGLATAPMLAERLGIVNTMRLGCVLAGAGSLLFAVSPEVWLLAIGRVAAGVGLGFAATLGPVFARETGGLPRVGVFGASFQFGIGAGLATGSLLSDAGAGWRVGFLVSALIGVSALPLLAAAKGEITLRRSSGGFLSLAARTPRVYRLGTLFIALFTVPLLLGAWMVHYLSVQGGMALALAGALSFVMFGASAALRSLGADLAARGVSRKLLRAGSPLLGAAGVALIAFSQSFGVALAAVVLMAAGFALPYAVIIVAAQQLYPEEPADPVALLTTVASAMPIALIPLFGVALADGHGEASLLAVAAFIALAGALNVAAADEPLVAAPEP